MTTHLRLLLEVAQSSPGTLPFPHPTPFMSHLLLGRCWMQPICPINPIHVNLLLFKIVMPGQGKREFEWVTYVNQKWTFFSLFSLDFEQIFWQILSITVKTLSNTNLVASRHIKREKGSLPFDEHCSKIGNLSTTGSCFTNGMASRTELDQGRSLCAKRKSLNTTTWNHYEHGQKNSVENVFISTFAWRILFEEPRIWTTGFNLRTRVLKSVTAAQERLDMHSGCHAAKILLVGIRGAKNVWCLSSLMSLLELPEINTFPLSYLGILCNCCMTKLWH